MLGRVPQPPESGCRIFEGPQLSQNWLQLRFLDWLALPRTLRFTWSTFGSLSFITKCLKTAFPLRSPPLTVLNSGKLPQGFVLEQNSISFSLKTCISSSRRIVLNSGKQGFLSNLQKDFHFHPHWQLVSRKAFYLSVAFFSSRSQRVVALVSESETRTKKTLIVRRAGLSTWSWLKCDHCRMCYTNPPTQNIWNIQAKDQNYHQG